MARPVRGPPSSIWSVVAYGGWTDDHGKGHQGHIAVVVDPAKHTVIDSSSWADGVTEHIQPVFWSGRHRVVWCMFKG
jgi:hypothetical protein